MTSLYLSIYLLNIKIYMMLLKVRMMKQLRVYFVLMVIAALTGCVGNNFHIAENRDVEIGVLLRKQFTQDVCQKRRYRHVHVLLDGNEIMGYNTGVKPRPAFIKYLLTYIPGEVRNYHDLLGIREHYIKADVAQNVTYDGEDGYKIVTDWVKIKVSREQAEKLRHSWYEMKKNPPDFRLWGDNCATRLSQNFAEAGILPHGLPGFDTPESVLKLLKKYYPDLEMETGYFGIDENRQITFIPLGNVCAE